MFDRTLFQKHTLTASVAIMSIVGLTACSKNASNTTNVTPQGTVQLDSVKVGMPESTFKDATITFVVDPKPAATASGRTQYLSRSYDNKKGQYVAQIKNGTCFCLQSLYISNPIPKEDALETLKALLPADAPPQSKVDDSHMKAGKKAPDEIYEFGDKYTGILQYVDPAGTKVSTVSAFNLGADAVREGLNWSGQAPKGGKAAKGAKPVVEKSTSVKKSEKSSETSTSTSTGADSTTESSTSTSTTTTP